MLQLYPMCREYSRANMRSIIRIDRGVIHIISYEALWRTLKAKGISTATLNDICNMLNCDITDVMKFTPDGD